MTARELLNICNLPGIAPTVSEMRAHAPAPTVSRSGPQCAIGVLLLTHNGVFTQPLTARELNDICNLPGIAPEVSDMRAHAPARTVSTSGPQCSIGVLLLTINGVFVASVTARELLNICNLPGIAPEVSKVRSHAPARTVSRSGPQCSIGDLLLTNNGVFVASVTARELLNMCNLPGIAPEVSEMRSHAPARTVSRSGPQCSIGVLLLTHNGLFVASVTARELSNICNLPGIAPEGSEMRAHAPARTVSTSGPQCSIGDLLLTHNGVFVAL